jgi:putative transcriptional regulator
MDEQLFDELVESVKQAKKILKGEQSPSRRFVYDDPDIKTIRMSLNLSQSKFASMIGVSLKTLQNWEQGIRSPRGPARALLKIVQREPEATLRALHS